MRHRQVTTGGAELAASLTGCALAPPRRWSLAGEHRLPGVHDPDQVGVRWVRATGPQHRAPRRRKHPAARPRKLPPRRHVASPRALVREPKGDVDGQHRQPGHPRAEAAGRHVLQAHRPPVEHREDPATRATVSTSDQSLVGHRVLHGPGVLQLPRPDGPGAAPRYHVHSRARRFSEEPSAPTLCQAPCSRSAPGPGRGDVPLLRSPTCATLPRMATEHDPKVDPLHNSPSRSANAARKAELDRVIALGPRGRMALALELGRRRLALAERRARDAK